jgi:hypothetical protein
MAISVWYPTTAARRPSAIPHPYIKPDGRISRIRLSEAVHCRAFGDTRALAFKWQRILLRCWHGRTSYDDATYVRSLKDRYPTLYQFNLTTKSLHDEKLA